MAKGEEKTQFKIYSLKARLIIFDNSQVNASCLDIFTENIFFAMFCSIFNTSSLQ